MRLDKLRGHLDRSGHYPYMVNDAKNIAYLCGFEGSYARLFVTENDYILLTDSRYIEYAGKVCGDDKVKEQRGKFPDVLSDLAASCGWKKIFVEESLTLSEFLPLQKSCAPLELVPAEIYAQKLRLVKDESELSIIKKAVNLADECLQSILAVLKEGIRESDVSAEIEYFFRKNGSSGSSFDTIVAFGAHSSMPHYNTGNARLRNGDVILIDTGCVVDGYCSDITRTFFYGGVDAEMERVYDIVNCARSAAIDKISSGISAGVLDRCARDIISEKGYGKAFGHSLGHGVGRDVHEAPGLRDGSEEILQAGSVVTIEPGIYIPGKGGVRIEDMVVTAEGGSELLTNFPRDLKKL